MRETLLSGWLPRTRARLAAVAGAAVLLLAGAVLLAAHGGGRSTPQQQAHPAAATSLNPTGAALVGNPAPGTSAPPSASRGAAASATLRPGVSSAPTASWFTVTLGASCVVPGGTQTLTAQSHPGYTVAYNSHYADGHTGDSYGGYGVVATDAHGRVVVSWTVSASAPLGPVTVGAGTANGGPATTLTRSFTVAAHC